MEVNKGEAERCRDIGAEALRSRQYARATKFLSKSQKLYPLPGVAALLSQAERRMNAESNGSDTPTSTSNHSTTQQQQYTRQQSSTSSDRSESFSSSAAPSGNPASTKKTGKDGRSYTEQQVKLVQQILKSKEGGRGAHYRVLGVETNADESALKKAYRKLALKLHPDKNSAPDADDAFKALGLAYATLSDPQKRTIYDRYGEEDPDNRGGGGGAGMRRHGGGVHFNGQEVNPEDIFNMFFGGGGMPGGVHMNMGGMPGGFRAYSTGFGGMPRQRPGQRQQQQQEQQQQAGGLGQLMQLLPIILLFAMSFFNLPGETTSGHTGGSHYFSLTHAKPYTNPLKTSLTKVKDIPFFVTDKFLRTYARDRYQLSQVERMVEKSYNKYLVDECNNQKIYKASLERQVRNRKDLTDLEKDKQLKKAKDFDLTRCFELNELFG